MSRVRAAAAALCLLFSSSQSLPQPPAGSAAGALGTLSRVFARDAAASFSVALDPGAACATVSGGGGAPLRVAARTAVDAVAAVAQYARLTFNASFAWALAGGSTLGSMPPPGSPLPPPAGGSLSLCRAINYTYVVRRRPRARAPIRARADRRARLTRRPRPYTPRRSPPQVLSKRRPVQLQ